MKEKILEYLLMGVLIIGTSLVFIFFDRIMDFVVRLLTGWKGVLVMLGVAIAITLFFAFFLKFNVKQLIFVAIIASVVCAAVWLYFNTGMVFGWLETTIGIWGAIGVGIVLIIVGWIVVHFIL